MKKLLVLVKVLVAMAVVAGLLLAFWAGQHHSLVGNGKTTSVAVGTTSVSTQSVKELVELTPVQQRLIQAGFDPRRVHAVTTK